MPGSCPPSLCTCRRTTSWRYSLSANVMLLLLMPPPAAGEAVLPFGQHALVRGCPYLAKHMLMRAFACAHMRSASHTVFLSR